MENQEEYLFESSFETTDTIKTTRRSSGYLKSEQLWKHIVSKDVAEGLIQQGILAPTRIQSKALSALDQKNRISIFQSQNGSGKTLAFLLLTCVRITKLGLVKYRDSLIFAPQAIIFVNCEEVGAQIVSAAKVLKDIFPEIKVGLCSRTDTNKTIPKCHILVGTPGTIDWAIHHKIVYLPKLKTLVVDEADFILDNSPGSETVIKIAQDMAHPNPKMFFFSANFTKKSLGLINSLNEPGYEVYESLLPNLLRMPPGISHYYIMSQDSKLINKILKITSGLTQSLIFVPSRVKAQNLGKRLANEDLSVNYFLVGGYEYTESEVKQAPEEREEIFSAFCNNELEVLVTTDLLARGFESKNVGLVINSHLPVIHDKKDHKKLSVDLYLHRAGRTGRFGDTGIVINILTDPKELESIKMLEDAYSLRMTKLDSVEDIKSLFELDLVSPVSETSSADEWYE